MPKTIAADNESGVRRCFLGLLSRERRTTVEGKSQFGRSAGDGLRGIAETICPFIREKVASVLVESVDASADQSGTSDEDDEEDPLLKDPRVILGCLHILANFSQHWSATIGLGENASVEEDSSTPSAELMEQLHNFCLGDSDVEAQNFNSAKESRAAELAAFTVAHFTEERMQLLG